MPDAPVVSIVTPSFNQGPYLEATIRSVLEQDYPHIEYIICDGGSTDESLSIIQRYADRLAWWRSGPDGGQANAVNQGWRRATGEIWAFLNSDDILLPGAVRAVVDAFRQQPAASVVYGDWDWIDQAGDLLFRSHGAPATYRQLLRYSQSHFIAQPASFYRAAMVRRAGLLDESLRYALDYDLLLKLGREGPLHYLPRPLAACRAHADAKTFAAMDTHIREAIRVQRRHAGPIFCSQYIVYLRYRLFRLLPRALRVAIRSRRQTPRDRLLLSAERTGNPPPE